MDAERLPTIEAYVYALDTLEPSLPPKHRALLRAHCGFGTFGIVWESGGQPA